MMASTIIRGCPLRRVPCILLLLVLGPAALLSTGCGIGFGSSDELTDPLAGLRITGTRTAGEELRVELAYSQTYPVPVEVECRLKQGNAVVQVIGKATIPANPEGSPEATPDAGDFSFPFRVEQAGEYKVVCLTVADETNKLDEVISIRPSS
jgi:hypothetical protein